jgi:predicted TIM-barrel fold metal-dependent hydrolase
MTAAITPAIATILLDASVYTQPKIDAHCHILDPQRFAYAQGVPYHPVGQETGSADYFTHVHAAYGVRHALLVQPNSGYSYDNHAMLDAIARSRGRFKGIAMVPNDASSQQLQDLKAQGVVGVAFNVALLGLDFYGSIGTLLQRLADLEMFANVQVERDQMATLAPVLGDSGTQVLVDHCGRPDLSAGLGTTGFAALLALADTGRTTVKLSGFSKFSQQGFPFTDARAHVDALLHAFGPARCLWASDWPFLRAASRLDYGPLLQLFASMVPDAAIREEIMWHTPLRLFGFGRL